MNPFKKLLLKLLMPLFATLKAEATQEEKELTKKTCLYLSWFFEENDLSRHLFEISDIKTEDESNTVIVTITLGRPGVLIGKGGRTIDSLKEHLTKHFQKNTEIRIIETTLWR